jgi:ribosomal protein S18 acetylase RimI-like enzyme
VTVTFRPAGPADAEAVAALHADSWRRHYRSAYSDEFLDGDVAADRLAVWTARLRNTFFDDDPTWGALLDNLHVADGQKRLGIGSRLLALTAKALLERPEPTGLYLWVLEQNREAQAFYEACGGKCVERRPVEPPGGIASRLNGTPVKLRYVWPQPEAMTDARWSPR